MKLSIISFIAALAAVTTASPVPDGKQASVRITFTGAADGEFTQGFNTDGSSQKISMFPFIGLPAVKIELSQNGTDCLCLANPLSVSKISAPKGVTCAFLGGDGQVTTVDGSSTANVAPPQTQITGTCRGN